MSFKEIAIEIADAYELMFLFLGVFGLLIKKAREQYKWLLFFLISIGFFRVVSIFFASNGLTTTPFYHLFGLLELLIVFKIYESERHSVIWKWVALIIGILYVSNSLFFNSIWEMNGLMQAIVQFFIFCLSTNYLLSIYFESSKGRKAIPAFFYANAGFMFYATGSFIVFLINERLIIGVTSDLFNNAWLIEACFGLIRLIFIGITLRLLNGK